MKYAFVAVSVCAVWVALIIMGIALGVESIFLPLVGLAMTLILFLIGFARK